MMRSWMKLGTLLYRKHVKEEPVLPRECEMPWWVQRTGSSPATWGYKNQPSYKGGNNGNGRSNTPARKQ